MSRNQLRNSSTLLRLALGVMAFAIVTSALEAEQVVFTIDQNSSSQTWIGSSDQNGPFVESSPGSLTTGVAGHFVVNFDPTTHTPSTMQFVGGHGYYRLATQHSAAPTFVPGTGWTTSESPAQVAGRLGAGGPYFAVRDFLWDVSSGPLALTGGAVSATQTAVTYDGGSHIDLFNPNWSPPFGVSLAVGGSEGFNLTGGSWTLSESAPGSGDWTITLAGNYYEETYTDGGGPFGSGTLGLGGTMVAKAHFSAANIAAVAPTDTHAEALGGASGATPGGVSASFNSIASGGTLTVQQVPSQDSLALAAITAAQSDPLFALSVAGLTAPQIWNVHLDGHVDGDPVTLTFHYDSALLPAGFDESTLVMWHFNKLTGLWDSGGTVHSESDTIEYLTYSFSDFALGVQPVPEPSTCALALAALGVVAPVAWRLRRQWRRVS